VIDSIFLNMPVSNVAKSMEFFKNLGFEFNPQFTGEDSACLIIGENKYAMLNNREKFANFIDKPIADSKTSEVIISLGCKSKEIVDSICEKALSQGARRIGNPEDQGFMYSWNFEDLDGHLWDLFWMDAAKGN
jgi:predicted lactoylglutathione lyase